MGRFGDIEVNALKDRDRDAAGDLWRRTYGGICMDPAYPPRWKESTRELESFLDERISAGRAIAARLDGKLAGYLAWDMFPFHGETSFFCPAAGHAAETGNREAVYAALYREASRLCVRQSVFSHYWTVFAPDTVLSTLLFDLGFGSYVVDCFRRSDEPVRSANRVDVRRAVPEDAPGLTALVDETKAYYASAPLFLEREKMNPCEVEKLIGAGAVFLAHADGNPVGFINVSVCTEHDPITLTEAGSGMIDGIGAYLRPGFRNLGMGDALVASAISFCLEQGIERIHVDYESANLYARRFWPKHFRPALLSLKRGVNRDAKA